MRQNRDEKFDKILEANMATDTRYLSQINGIWHFDFTVPQCLKKWFKQQRIRHSLNISDYKQARFIRDKYLIPVLATQSAIEVLENVNRFLDIAKSDLGNRIGDLVTFIDRTHESRELSIYELCQDFLKQYKKGDFADASVNKISSDINSFCGIVGKDTSAESITKQDIIRFRDILSSLPVGWQKRPFKGENCDLTQAGKDEKCVHPNTIKKQIEVARRIFAWGIADCKLRRKDNPAIGVEIIGSGKQTHKRPPEGTEVEKLCNLPIHRSSHFDEEAWRLLPIFARYTACRIGEITLLTVKDVVIKNEVECLRITAYGEEKHLKTASSERLVPISDKLKPFVTEIVKNRTNGPMFKNCGHWYDDKGNIRKPAHYFLKAYNNAAKKIAPDFSIHCWRVYGNTQMADAGIDILDREAVLGHKSDRIQKVYTAENLKRLKRAVDTIA